MKLSFLFAGVFITAGFFCGCIAHAESKRDGKTWGWVGQAGDIYLGGGQDSFGGGAGLLFYLGANAILSVEGGGGTNLDFWNSIGGDTVNGSNARVGVYYSGFVTNSIYIKGGFEDRYLNYNVIHYPDGIPGHYSQTATINLYCLWLGFGNQWNIKDHLIVGADWFGVNVPIANSGYSESDSGAPYGSWDLKSRLTEISVDLVRAYIGMTY